MKFSTLLGAFLLCLICSRSSIKADCEQCNAVLDSKIERDSTATYDSLMVLIVHMNKFQLDSVAKSKNDSIGIGTDSATIKTAKIWINFVIAFGEHSDIVNSYRETYDKIDTNRVQRTTELKVFDHRIDSLAIKAWETCVKACYKSSTLNEGIRKNNVGRVKSEYLLNGQAISTFKVKKSMKVTAQNSKKNITLEKK